MQMQQTSHSLEKMYLKQYKFVDNSVYRDALSHLYNVLIFICSVCIPTDGILTRVETFFLFFIFFKSDADRYCATESGKQISFMKKIHMLSTLEAFEIVIQCFDQ